MSKQKAHQVVKVWYGDACENGRNNYEPAKQRAREPIPDVSRQTVDKSWQDPAIWNSPAIVTADGVETRPPPQGNGLRHETHDVKGGGGKTHAEIEAINFARKSMSIVHSVDPNYHIVLEMRIGAGYSFPEIQEEFEKSIKPVSEPTLRCWYEGGLGVIRGVIEVREYFAI